MDVADVGLLLIAGVAAGGMNALAGGGSLMTFPALIGVGLPPVAANVTNSVAVCPGYLSSVLGSRADLAGQGLRLRHLLPTTLAGSLTGCALLLGTPARAFEAVVPFLVLTATAAFAFQERLRHLVGRSGARPERQQSVRLRIIVFTGSVYGGYFGAALGVMLVAALALVLDERLSRINALKNVLSTSVGLVTVLVFAIFGPVDWLAASALAPATITGGYAGARLARRLPADILRVLIVIFGTTIAVLLLVRYWIG